MYNSFSENVFTFGWAGPLLLHVDFACGLQGLFFTAVHGLLTESLLLLWSAGSRHAGFSSCRRQAQKLQLSGPAVAAHGPSSAKVSVVVARGLSSCSLWVLELELGSHGAWA